jgi:hypothetical protein
VAADFSCERAEQAIRSQNSGCPDHRLLDEAEAAQRIHCCGAHQAGRSVESPNAKSFSHDYTGSQKSDSRDDLRGDLQ